jgi:hypothetical protein
MLALQALLLALLGVAAASLARAVGSDASTRDAEPLTLVGSTLPIYGFAQDDGVLAWEECCGGEHDIRSTIRVRSARNRTIIVSRFDGGDGPIGIDQFALGGQRVLWAGFTSCCLNGYGYVETAAPASRPNDLQRLGLEEWVWGDYPAGAAGDGATLVYSVTQIVPLNEAGDWHVAGGETWRVVGRKRVRVPLVPPAALIAAARGRVAVVPADLRTFDRSIDVELSAARRARVQIRDAVSGALLSSFSPNGRVTAIGMDAGTVAAIVRSGRQARVEWYSARSGEARGSVDVDPAVTDTIDVSGRTVVLARGMRIFAVDTALRRLRELSTSNSKPIGLSIEGTRVAWAENVGKERGSIRAVTVR